VSAPNTDSDVSSDEEPLIRIVRAKHRRLVIESDSFYEETDYATKIKCTGDTRRGLMDSGLMDRVRADHPLLKEFDEYMQHSKGVESHHHRSNIINHVRRLHHFIQKSPTDRHPCKLDVNALMNGAGIPEFCKSTKGTGKKNLNVYLLFLKNKFDIRFNNKPLCDVVEFLISCDDPAINTQSRLDRTSR
jgi:hypothetical protein